ncbi:MAG TPA: hypothetical protein VKV69_14200, partial [Actinomycetota bacterium]|nr:hypothetical protein [Actinomycetota bacterium]
GSFLLTPTFSFSPATGIIINSSHASGSDYVVNVSIATSAPTGSRDVIVNDGLGSSTCTKCFTVTPPPTVSSINPTTLASGGGPITYTITGTGFLPGATVQISGNGVTAGSATVAGDGKSLTIPLAAASTAVAGVRNVAVTNTDSQQGKCTGCLLIVGPPRATGIFPAQRAAGLTNQVIYFVGSGFDSTTTVAFSSSKITQHSPAEFLNANTLRTTIDVSGTATPGTTSDVTFDNSDNGGHSVCTGCFTITGPTSVAITTPSTVNGPIVATFSQPVSGVSSSNSFVRFTGHTYNLATSIACADQDGFLTNCATGSVKTAMLQPTSNITPGQHYTVHIAESGQPAITDFGGLTVSEATQDFRGGLFQQGEGAASAFTWRVVKTANAFGGSYVVDHVAGASASYRFTGSQITWYTIIGPNYGIADLYVDGVLRATANSYSSSTHYRAAFTVSGFSYGKHTLTVRVRGSKGSRFGSGTDVAVDAFQSGSSIIASPGLTYTWGIVKAAAASAGAYSWTDEGGATVSFTFRGTQLEWDTVLGPQMGRAKVYIDGVLKNSADNYAGTTTYGVAKIFPGLSDAVHTVTIIVLGTHRTASTGSYVAIDRWVVT